MINLGSVVTSRKFAQSVTVNRKTGTWVSGRWVPGADAAIAMNGTITIPSETDLEQIPEGDRQKGAICFHSQSQIYLTNTSGTSDEILWRNEKYRVSKLLPYADYGFYKCIAIRMDDV